MRKMHLKPLKSKYVVDDSQHTHRVELDGGAGRYRLDFINATKRITADFLLNESDNAYFGSFFRRAIHFGSKPFLIDLLIDGLNQEYTAYLINKSLVLNEEHDYELTLQLEVNSNQPDNALDDSILDLYDAYGSDASEILAKLETFANETLPEKLNHV